MSTLSKYCISFSLLIFFLSAGIPSKSQDSNEDTLIAVTLTHSSGVKWTSLRIGGGIGGGVFRDMGTAPISFKGILMQPVLGIEFGGTRDWTVTLDMQSTVGFFEDALPPRFNFGSFDIVNMVRFKMLHHLATPQKEVSRLFGTWLRYGIGASNFLDVTVNPSYENAAAGVSYFVGPEVSLRADIYLVFTDNKSLHAEMGCMPMAAVMRPGFAYIDNYTATQPVLKALFDNYEWYLKPFGGIYTDIGFDILNYPYAHLSISYRWEFHSSGEKGPWRFDHATHLLCIDFYYTLKTHHVCKTSVSQP